jgi:hypothetical protein
VVYSQDASRDFPRGSRPETSGRRASRSLTRVKSTRTAHLVRVVNAVVARCAQVRSCISERGARSAGRVAEKRGFLELGRANYSARRRTTQMSFGAGKGTHRRGGRTTPRGRSDSSRSSRVSRTCRKIQTRRVSWASIRRPRRVLCRRRTALTIRFLTRSFAFFFPTVPKSLSFPSPRAALIGPWDKAHPSYPNRKYRRVNFPV